MEEDGRADGQNQALLDVPSDRCQLETDGEFWKGRQQCLQQDLLRSQVQFGSNPSTGTLFRASQFLSEELPIRLAHRVQELDDLPDGMLRADVGVEG